MKKFSLNIICWGLNRSRDHEKSRQKHKSLLFNRLPDHVLKAVPKYLTLRIHIAIKAWHFIHLLRFFGTW